MTRRAAAWLLLGVFAAFSRVACAMFAEMSEAELVAASDAIVIGELVGSAQVQFAGTSLNLGVVRVATVLKGDPKAEILLLVLPHPKAPRSGADTPYRTGQRGLWFLRLRAAGEQGLYAADHPQRFVPMEKAKSRIPALRERLNLR